MKQRFKRSISMMLSAIMIASTLPVTALATDLTIGTGVEESQNDIIIEEPKKSGDGQSSDVKLIAEVAKFDVTIPTILPVDVDSNNNVTVATNVELLNNSAGPIHVSNIAIEDRNGWTKVSKPTQLVGKQEYTLDVGTQDAVIPSYSNTAIIYSSEVSPQKHNITDTVMANVVFQIGWYTDDNNTSNDEAAIALSRDRLEMYPGSKEYLEVVSKDISKERQARSVPVIEWSSSNPKIADVDNGYITANQVGSSIVTAKYKSVEATCVVTVRNVNAPTNAVEFSKDTTLIQKGTNEAVLLTYNYELLDPNDTIRLVSSNTSIVEVEPNVINYNQTNGVSSVIGLFTKSVGEATITATTSKGSTATINVKVNQPITNIFIEGASEVAAGSEIQLKATKNPTDTTDTQVIKWSSSDGSVATVNQAGTVTGLSGGTAIIKAQCGFYEATHSITVTGGGSEVEPPYEGEAPLEGEEYVSGNYSYVYGRYYNTGGIISTSKWDGWSVKILDKTKTSYVQPLEEIKGKPVTGYNRLFSDYPNTTLTLEGTWTNSNVTNMGNMFINSKATTLDLSNFNTTNVTNMASMFAVCQATTLDLSSFDTSNVTTMNAMFMYNKATSLDLSSFNTSNVTNMGWMFASCTATTLGISSFNTSNVTTMNSMFGSSQATTLDLSNFDTTNVTAMDNMFKNCQATTGYAKTQSDADKLNSSSDKPSTLTFIVKQSTPIVGEEYTEGNYKYAYSSDYSINGDILASKFDGWSVAIIDKTKTSYTQPLEEIKGKPVTRYRNLFNNYPNTTLTLEGTWTNRNITSMKDMFWGSKATTLNLSNFKTDSVTDMAEMFMDCKATTINLSGFNTSNVTDMNYMFGGCAATTLDLSNFNTSKVTNMASMFGNCKATTLDLSNFNTLNVRNMSNMFNGCQSNTIDLSSFNTSNVTNMYQMFKSSKASTLDLSSFDTSKVTDMESMFEGCSATTGYAKTQAEADKFNSSDTYKPSTLTFKVKGAVVVGEEYTDGNYKYVYGKQYNANGTIGSETISGWSVKIIDKTKTSYAQPLEEINGKPVVSYGYMFYQYPNTSLTLEGTWTNSNVTSIENMFEECKATTLNLRNFKTSNVTNMYNTFYNCQATTINVSGLDTSKVTDMIGIFYGCQAPTLDLSSFDTTNLKFNSYMFTSSVTTTGYAKTQADADKLNSSSNKPTGLTFKVKELPIEGEEYVEGNYSYVYGRQYNTSGIILSGKISGWSVKIIDKTQTSYIQPLEEIKGEPVTSYCNLFYNYPNTALVLEGTWSNKNITSMISMFRGCKATTLNLSNFKTSNVTTMYYMFTSSQSKELDLSSFDTGNVTNMSYMFAVSKATTLNLSSFKTDEVTDMSYMFNNCAATTLDLSNFNTSNVTNMTATFMACQSTILNLSSFDISNVDYMRSMFRACRVTTLDLSSFDTSNVKDMDGIFWSCVATVGYTKTQADADKFNSTSNKPSTLKFIVKPAVLNMTLPLE